MNWIVYETPAGFTFGHGMFVGDDLYVGGKKVKAWFVTKSYVLARNVAKILNKK